MDFWAKVSSPRFRKKLSERQKLPIKNPALDSQKKFLLEVTLPGHLTVVWDETVQGHSRPRLGEAVTERKDDPYFDPLEPMH